MKIGFIGTGNMGAALARAVAKKKGDNKIFLADFDRQKAQDLAEEINAVVSDNVSLILECDLVFLGVKPQVLDELMREIRPVVAKREKEIVLCSMAAGISLATLEAGLGEVALIRIMPNMPVAVGEGVIVYCTRRTDSETERAFAELLSEGGCVEKIEETKIDAASALHGCGPAFVYLFIEALADGAVSCGLTREQAIRFAAATVKGAAETVLVDGRHPAALKDAVCSPGGTTIEGVKTLEELGFRGATIDAVRAAYEKTVKLGQK